MSRMLDRFLGDEGRELRLEAFLIQTIVGRDIALAEKLADQAELLEFDSGQTAELMSAFGRKSSTLIRPK